MIWESRVVALALANLLALSAHMRDKMQELLYRVRSRFARLVDQSGDWNVGVDSSAALSKMCATTEAPSVSIRQPQAILKCT